MVSIAIAFPILSNYAALIPGMMFPLFLNLSGRLAVVIGGGAVGRRKANALAEAGARVRVVCLEPKPIDIPSDWQWHAEPYNSSHLDGAALVFAAANSEVNRQVVAESRNRGIWVNVAVQPDLGDFFVPAVVRRGDFVLAVSTGGAGPALAQAVRAKLEMEYDERFGQWAKLLAELRPLILVQIPEPARRRKIFHCLCEWNWLDRLHSDGPTTVRAAMLALVEAMAEGREGQI